MSENQVKYSILKQWEQKGTDFKIVKVNVSDPAESLYAVVSPVKNIK